jgi:hypothetical protein
MSLTEAIPVHEHISSAELTCGCAPGHHVGPGCPVWRGDPPKFMITAINMVTRMEDGVLFISAAGGRWIPLRYRSDYAFLNRALAEYRVEYERVRSIDR